MGKKILCAVLIVTSFFFVSPGLAKTGKTIRPVRILMNDNSVINGDFLGQNAGVVSILNEEGELQNIDTSKIKKVFDAEGNVIALSAQGKSLKEEAPQYDEEKHRVKPKRVAKQKNPMKTLGKFMTFGGLGVGIIGAILYVNGNAKVSKADKDYNAYLYSPDYTAYPYLGYDSNEMLNKTNTYEQDTLAGQNDASTGMILGCVGFAVGLTGVILWNVGSSREQASQTSLMHLEDGQVAWAMPEIQMQPRGGTRMTLLSAKF